MLRSSHAQSPRKTVNSDQGKREGSTRDPCYSLRISQKSVMRATNALGAPLVPVTEDIADTGPTPDIDLGPSDVGIGIPPLFPMSVKVA